MASTMSSGRRTRGRSEDARSEDTRSEDARSEDARVEAIHDSFVLAPERTPRIKPFVASLVETFGRPLACFSVLDRTTQHVRYGARELLGSTPREDSLCQHLVAGTDELMIVGDTLADPRFSHLPSVDRRSGVRFYAGSVVRASGGARLGALCVLDRVPGAFSTSEGEALRDATHALERLLEAHRAERADLRQVLSDMCRRLPLASVPVALQPIVCARTLRPVGSEALLRWQRADGSVVRPDLLIPQLENAGLIIAVDQAVLRTACRQAARSADGVGVSVNVSGAWFKGDRDRLTPSVETALAECGLDPGRLTIEVTEQVMIADPVSAAATFGRLKRLGVRLALDDFGTGYSSLSHLASYPFDVIKLDRSFLCSSERNDKAEKLIAGVIQLGRAVGMQVCVEGVETDTQLAFLQSVGCDLLQGFLIDAMVR